MGKGCIGGSSQAKRRGFKDYEDGEYVGELVNDKRHGKGKMEYYEDDDFEDISFEGVYEGKWVNDKRHGRGVMKFYRGRKVCEGVYDGEWVNDKREGTGTMTFIKKTSFHVRGQQLLFKDVVRYEGQWKNDLWDGDGRMTFEKGMIQYLVEYDDPKHNKYITSDEDIVEYNGSWKENRMHGQGTMTYGFGQVFEGQWIHAMKGQGKMIFPLGDSYEGKWNKSWKGISVENGTMVLPTGRSQSASPGTKKTNQTRKNKTLVMSELLRKQIVCTESHDCLLFGKETDKIKTLFRGFSDLTLVDNIEYINHSTNGFVSRIDYKIVDYQSSAVLKYNKGNMSDSLNIEAAVGIFVNKLNKRFPCFIETYGLYQIQYPSFYYCLKYLDLEQKVSPSNTDVIQQFSKKNTILTKLPFTTYPAMIEKEKHLYDCLLIQYLNAKKVYALTESEMKLHGHYIWFQVMSVLYSLKGVFYHYDLHYGNVLVCDVGPNKVIRFIYHFKGGRKIEFFSPYIAKIIDYGRCSFKDERFAYHPAQKKMFDFHEKKFVNYIQNHKERMEHFDEITEIHFKRCVQLIHSDDEKGIYKNVMGKVPLLGTMEIWLNEDRSMTWTPL